MESPRYCSFNKYLQKTFNCRVYKVSIDAGFTCPNRDGTKDTKGCIFCDEKGSSSQTHEENTPLKEQIIKNINVRKTRYKAKKFIVYFQSFTNTYAPICHLKNLYFEAIKTHPDIIGLAISTRADSVDEEKIKLIASYKKYLPYVSIEFGMQSMHNKTLKKINRQESHEDFLKAIELTKKYDLDSCAHVIIGLPDETREEMLQTADCLARLKVNGVKIHLLLAMTNTELAKLYEEGKWNPLSKDEYISLVADFLERVHSNCIIHRTSGNGYPKDIVAPQWIYEDKTEIMQAINNEMIRRKTHQGCFCKYP